MTFKDFSENYDGCIYVVNMVQETAFAIWSHYFMKYENAIEYLWNYYLYHYGNNLDADDREHARWTLETTGYIDGVGSINEYYFEDFDPEDEKQ